MTHLEQNVRQNVKQIQRLILSPQMQQALHLLQLPILELGNAIVEEMAQNPLLELSDNSEAQDADVLDLANPQELMREPPSSAKREEEDLKSFIENTIAYETSLFDHLMKQARETFLEAHERKIAETIIGNLDRDGILTTPLEEIAALAEADLCDVEDVLREIQSFDPPGVGAQSIKEALLIQLKSLGKERSLAFHIVERHYEDVMHNRLPLIAKALSHSVQEIRSTIAREIASLDLHPGTNQAEGHYRQLIHNITPDITIIYHDDKFTIEINDDHLPPLKLNQSYLHMLHEPHLTEETRSYIQEKISSGKWLLRNLQERHQTLYRITEELLKNQTPFFSSPKGKLIPLTMKEIAEKLELHESTIARAVANKYLSCMRGILPLRSFFTHSYTTESGENISAQSVKDLVIELINSEDKYAPLSDETLSNMIKERGIPCARRTVAKYRQELNIGNTTQRRLH